MKPIYFLSCVARKGRMVGHGFFCFLSQKNRLGELSLRQNIFEFRRVGDVREHFFDSIFKNLDKKWNKKKVSESVFAKFFLREV